MRLPIIVAGAAFALSSTSAAAQEPAALFDQWLAAVNSGDPAQVRTFYASELQSPNPAYPLEVAVDTCGFDVVRTQQEGSKLVALVAERCFPALQRITVTPAVDDKPATIAIQPYALSAEGALAWIDGAARRLAERDEMAGTLLVRRGAEEWVRNYGFVDHEQKVPIDADTPFLLASAGKMFTAVAIHQLFEQGRVELDAPLGTYLPEYPNADMARVTIRQLLSHRGGTGDMQILARNEGDNRAAVSSIADIIALNGERSPEFPPGTQGSYSNYGYLLLGAVVEAASGEDYYDYVQHHIFDVAGMTDAGFPLREEMAGVPAGLTTFYGEEETLQPSAEVLPWRGTPGGGGVASAHDFLKFFDALENGKLIRPETFAAAREMSETPGFGMGFVVTPGRNWGHGGNGYGMDVAAHHYIAEDTDFICLAARDMVCNRLITAWFIRTIVGLTE